MKALKLPALFLTGSLLLAGCNQLPQEENVYNNPEPYAVEGAAEYGDDVRAARENFDLRAVGALLERAESAEEFEYLLNDPEQGVNNLDLNGDGYTDYISVREFGEGDQREFSLFDMFGPDLIQEIATIFLDRTGGDFPGARVLLRGNEQIYGDGYNYETNWLDRALPIITSLFDNRSGDDDYYASPYYYENYPDYYEPYAVVETPVYRERIEQYYATPVFVQTAQPTVTNIRIVSPNEGRTMNKIYSKLAKPTREQVEFTRSNPKPPKFERAPQEKPEFVRERQEKFKDKPGKPDKAFKDNQRFERREKFDAERSERREKPNKAERIYVEQPKPMRVEKQKQPKFEERRNQPKFERPDIKPPKAEKQNGNPNRGGGNGNGGGNKGGGKGKGGKP